MPPMGLAAALTRSAWLGSALPSACGCWSSVQWPTRRAICQVRFRPAFGDRHRGRPPLVRSGPP
eukprot:11923481-Alexandrium_andersonii.AAC.1